MKPIQKWSGVAFSILLSIGLTFLVIGLPLQNTILRAGFTQQAVQQTEFFSRLPDAVAGTMFDTLTKRTRDAYSPFLDLLTREHINILISETLPDNWLQKQVDEFLTSFNDFLNLRVDHLEFIINLTPVKANIAGDAGVDAITGILATFPECSIENVLAITAAILLGNSEGITLCNPPSELLELLKPFLKQALALTTSALPEKETIPIFARQASDPDLTIQRIYSGYQLIYQFGKLIPWVCGACALLVILLAAPQLKYILQGLGYPLLIGGVVGGFLLLGGTNVGVDILTRLPQSVLLPDYLENTMELVVQIGNTILGIIRKQGLAAAGIAVAAGFVILLVAILIRKKN